MEPIIIGDAKLYQGDALEVLYQVGEGTVQTCVTSPPYWMQRSYLKCPKCDFNSQTPKCPECGHVNSTKHLERGREKTPQEYVDNLVKIFRGVRKSLHPTGTLWVNIGDKREGGTTGVPWRFAEAMRTDGWMLQADCIWVKDCAMPASVEG